jgi:hypothetical protein
MPQPPPSTEKPRRPYSPPRLESLELKGEEMAAASCKTATSTTGPAVGCLESACRDIGS